MLEPRLNLDRDTLRRRERVVHDVPGIARLGRFKDQDLGFLVGGRAMLDATGDDAVVARGQLDDAVAKLDPETTLPDQEELLAVFMAVPGKDASHLDDLEFLAVETVTHLRQAGLQQWGV